MTIGHHSLHDASSKTARREFCECRIDTIYATLSHVDRSTATGDGEFPSNVAYMVYLPVVWLQLG